MCVCIHIYECMYIYIYVCVCLYICVCVCVCVYIYMCVCVCVYIYVCVCVCVCVYVFLNTYEVFNVSLLCFSNKYLSDGWFSLSLYRKSLWTRNTSERRDFLNRWIQVQRRSWIIQWSSSHVVYFKLDSNVLGMLSLIKTISLDIRLIYTSVRFTKPMYHVLLF